MEEMKNKTAMTEFLAFCDKTYQKDFLAEDCAWYAEARRLASNEKPTAYSLSALYEIIEARDMNYAKGLIITSNLSLAGLSERLGDDRITSRLAGMCRVVQITGNDHRLR